MAESETVRILRLAAASALPKRIDGSTPDISAEKFRELYDADLVDAIDASNNDGPGYLHPTITPRGREYLEENTHKFRGSLRPSRAQLLFGVLVVVLAAILLKLF